MKTNFKNFFILVILFYIIFSLSCCTTVHSQFYAGLQDSLVVSPKAYSYARGQEWVIFTQGIALRWDSHFAQASDALVCMWIQDPVNDWFALLEKTTGPYKGDQYLVIRHKGCLWEAWNLGVVPPNFKGNFVEDLTWGLTPSGELRITVFFWDAWLQEYRSLFIKPIAISPSKRAIEKDPFTRGRGRVQTEGNVRN